MESEWVLGKSAGEGVEVDSVGSGQRTVMGSCEHGDEPSGCDTMKLLRKYHILHI
jgi:hypothetical protein